MLQFAAEGEEEDQQPEDEDEGSEPEPLGPALHRLHFLSQASQRRHHLKMPGKVWVGILNSNKI